MRPWTTSNPHHQGLNYPTGRIVRGLVRQNHLRGRESNYRGLQNKNPRMSGLVVNVAPIEFDVMFIAKCNASSTKIRAIFCNWLLACTLKDNIKTFAVQCRY